MIDIPALLFVWAMGSVAGCCIVRAAVMRSRLSVRTSILEAEIARLRRVNQEQATIIKEYELSEGDLWAAQAREWWDNE